MRKNVVVVYGEPSVKLRVDITFEEGWTCLCGQHTTVKVEARTWAHINKHGGVGRVVKYNGDLTYAVRYLLGGHEKSVDMCYITCNAEAASKREGKSRDFYDPRVVQTTTRRPTRGGGQDKSSMNATAVPATAQCGVMDGRPSPLLSSASDDGPVQKKSKIIKSINAKDKIKMTRPLQPVACVRPPMALSSQTPVDENQQPNFPHKKTQQHKASALSKPVAAPEMKSRPKLVTKASFEPPSNTQPLPTPRQQEPTVTLDGVVARTEEEQQPEVPGLKISIERRKEFNVLMSAAFGVSDCLSVDELRQTCASFTSEEVDVLLATIEKEGRVLIDGTRVYWC